MIGDASSAYEEGRIYMACDRNGYVGLVRTETGDLAIAAALDPYALKVHGGIGRVVCRLIGDAGLPPVSRLMAARWRGTGFLTRSANRLAIDRFFVVGDAAGFVEPFTGEGIGWALMSGIAIAPIAYQACQRWHADLADWWAAVHRCRIVRRQMVCRLIAKVLHQRAMTNMLVSVLRHAPFLALPVVHYLNAAPILRGTSAGPRPDAGSAD
jgi:2-polyprenyl-6-methoxyphenol hydroxylase-like FAD-dependent oxidoreductase